MPAIPWNSRIIVEAAAIAALVLLLLWAIWWLWWRLPKRQVRKLDIQIHDPKARADTEDNFRKTIGQALGGAAVLIGAAAAYLQFTQQQQASHDLLVSNQVSKGFEQLAGDKLAMRLGGIYALEGVMNTSPEYHDPVLEALCAFVRDGTIDKTVGDHPATDIQAVLGVLGRLKSGSDRVVLAQANIPGANLLLAKMRKFNLSHANLSSAYMGGADLYLAGLFSADLSGVNLTAANLSGAFLDDANLTGADLLTTNLNDASLAGADLTGVLHLSQKQLDQACGKPKALPPGLSLDKPCRPLSELMGWTEP